MLRQVMILYSSYIIDVDRLYEQWLDQYSDADFPNYQPNMFNYGVAPGHNIINLQSTNISTDDEQRNAQQSNITWLYL